MAEKATHRLELYRGHSVDKDSAIESGALGVENYLAQFTREDRVTAALRIAAVIGADIKPGYGDVGVGFYSIEIGDQHVLNELAEAEEGLRWIADLAALADHTNQTPS